jgi:hypothetical protein
LEKVFSTAQIFGRRRCEVSAWETMQRPTPRSVPPNLSALHEQGVTATRAVVPSAAAAFEAQLISIIDVSISKELPHLGPCSAGGAAIGARSGVFVGGATGVNSVQASGLSPGASSPPDCWLSIRSHAGR